MSAAELKIKLLRQITDIPDEDFKKCYPEIAASLRGKPIVAYRNIGSMKGVLKYMAPDFNEPLDDFKEYMP